MFMKNFGNFLTYNILVIINRKVLKKFGHFNFLTWCKINFNETINSLVFNLKPTLGQNNTYILYIYFIHMKIIMINVKNY